MRKYFPSFSVKNIAIFYWLGIFLNGWFILPNWVFFYQLYLSQGQIGLIEGISVLVGIIMEVPSGVCADLLGKKNTLLAGNFFLILSSLFMIYAHTFLPFLIGSIFGFIGFAFHSGATEAFAFDSLKENGIERHYGAVISRYTSLSIFATLISTFLGGYLFHFSPTGPYYAWIVFIAIASVLLLFTKEPQVDSSKFSFRGYFKHLTEGVVALFSKSLRIYLIPIFGVAVFIKLYQGLVRQSMAGYFGYNGETFGYLFALVSIPAIYLSFKYDLIKKFFSEKTLILSNLFVLCISFFVAYTSRNLLTGVFVYLLINLVESFSTPLISSIINDRIDSRHRATTLSTLALFRQIPYIILVIFFAFMTELQNIRYLFLIYGLTLLSILSVSVYIFRSKPKFLYS